MAKRKPINRAKGLKLYTRGRGNTTWYVRGVVGGVSIRESTGTASREHAEAYRVKREGELLAERYQGKRPRMTFSEAAESYLMTHRLECTQHAFAVHDHFGKMQLTDIDQRAVDKYVAEHFPNAQASTVFRYLTPLISVLRHAADAGWCLPHKIKRPKPEKRKPAKYGDDDWFNVALPWMKEHDPALHALVLVMTTTGARVSEALALTSKDVHHAKGTLSIWMSKTKEPRIAPLTDETRDALTALSPVPAGSPLFGDLDRNKVHYRLTRMANEANIEPLSAHSVGRHSFAARFLKQGHSLKMLAEAGGWANTKMPDEVYGHLETSNVHDAMRDAAQTLGKR